MSPPFKLNVTSAALIYLILLSGVIAIIIAWKMLPKEATEIHVFIANEATPTTYAARLPEVRLYYSIDDTCVRIYADGVIYLHPLANVRSMSVR